jgi:TolB protein
MSLCCAGAAFCAAATVASLAGAGAGEAPVWNETTLVSRQSASAGGAGGTGGSSKAAISANGRYVAFASDSNNLSDVDNDGFSNVFVRDTRAGETTLVSRRSAGEGGAGADAVSFNASISADGRYVAFASDADNLSGSDSDAELGVDVFVRDLETHTTTLVSRQTSQGGAGGDEFSNFPSISADGRYVTFVSDADNLSTADVEEVVDVFVRDLQSNTTTLVSRQSGPGGAGADDVSSFPAISPDGRYVAFQSSADNLSTADNNAVRNIYVRDLQSNTTTLVSRQSGPGGAGADGASSEAAISADGRYVAFQSDADNLSAADDNRFTNLFVRDLQSSAMTLVSRQSAGQGGAPADGISGFPAISADGRYVAFQSDADNLSGGDAVVRDVFVRDLDANETSLISRQSANAGGAGGDGSSFLAAISADGRFVAFDSGADNLDSASDDVFTNVFLSSRVDPPGLDLSGKKTQKLGKPVKLRVSCDELCSVTATGLVKPKGKPNGHGKRAKRLELTEADAELEADETKALKLSPSRRVARKLQRSAKATVKITVTAADLARNSTEAKLKIKLR